MRHLDQIDLWGIRSVWNCPNCQLLQEDPDHVDSTVPYAKGPEPYGRGKKLTESRERCIILPLLFALDAVCYD